MFSCSESNGPRVKFLRKALMPKDQDQFKTFLTKVEILVSTPERLSHLFTLSQGQILSSIDMLIIDEADKMFEMGFM